MQCGNAKIFIKGFRNIIRVSLDSVWCTEFVELFKIFIVHLVRKIFSKNQNFSNSIYEKFKFSLFIVINGLIRCKLISWVQRAFQNCSKYYTFWEKLKKPMGLLMKDFLCKKIGFIRLYLISRVQWCNNYNSIYYITRVIRESREMKLRNHAMRIC